MPEETRAQRYKRQTAEQFEALGRFVQAFEQMVWQVRFNLGFLTHAPQPAAIRVMIILNHRSLTAWPLLEILRGVTGQMMKEGLFEGARKAAIVEVSQEIRNEYQTLVEVRNTILHGTWHIGYASKEQEDFSTFRIEKGKATFGGGYEHAKVPKSAKDLHALELRCELVNGDLLTLLSLMVSPADNIEAMMRARDNRRKRTEARFSEREPE